MDESKKISLGQFFTPTHIVKYMIGLMTKNKNASILEPSSGNGVFLDSLIQLGYTNLTS
ncbi:TPA: N-6 DNA methylase, partial [Haemophilus influenzae]